MTPRMWSIVRQEMKYCQSLSSFKKRYKEMETMEIMETTFHVGYAKPTCKMLVFHNKYVWYQNKNFFIFIIHMLYNRCIFFFFYIFFVFPINRSMLT